MRRRKIYNGKGGDALRAIMKTKAVFVHVPKCGGKTVVRDIYGLNEHEYFGHASIMFYNSVLGPARSRDFRSFAFLRDPVDRCQSAYRFIAGGAFGFPDEKELQERVCSRNFDQFVMDGVLRDVLDKNVVFAPQYKFVTDSSGLIKVDHLLDFANFKKELQSLFPLKGREISHENKSKVPEAHSVSPDAARIIREIYNRDYDLFGVLFDWEK